MTSAPRRLTAVAVVLATLVALGCGNNDEAFQVEIGRLTAELNEVRAKHDAAAQKAVALERELQQIKDRNASLTTERDALQKRVNKLQATARPAAPDAATTQALPREENKSVREARGLTEALAAALFAHEQHELARSIAQTAVELGSKRPDLHFQMAYSSAESADYATAAKEYERAVDMLKDQPDADQELLKKCLNNWGAAAAHLGETERAEKLYVRVLALDPAFAPASFNLGLLYSAKPGHAADAVRMLRDYVTSGGPRGASARELILKLQPPQEAPAAPPAG